MLVLRCWPCRRQCVRRPVGHQCVSAALRKARGRIVQVSTWTASVPLPFNGPSGASKAAMEVFSAVYRAELKSFGIDVVVAAAGNMRTGGPAKTASAPARMADGMTPDQRALYGQRSTLSPQDSTACRSSGLDRRSAADARDRTRRAGSRAKPRRGRSRRREMLRAARRKIRRRTRMRLPPRGRRSST